MICRATKLLSTEAQFNAGVNLREDAAPAAAPAAAAPAPKIEVSAPPIASHASDVGRKPSDFSHAAIQNQEDAPPCSTCGSIMIRSGSCYKCTNCGTTSGCA